MDANWYFRIELRFVARAVALYWCSFDLEGKAIDLFLNQFLLKCDTDCSVIFKVKLDS